MAEEAKAAPEFAKPAVASSAASGPVEGDQASTTGGLSADEERQLGRLLARREAASGAGEIVRMRVEGPHESLTHAGITVGREWTEVPAGLSSALTTAAEDAGVLIVQEA